MAPPNGRKPLGIQDYGIIGDMHTCALVGTDGSIDFCCWPTFDSPSLFGRVLDTTAGGCGHWSVRPTVDDAVVKQSYVPSTNILQTKWINQEGVVSLKDFFVIRKPGDDRGPTLVRRLECIRGHMDIEIEVAPAPNYAQPTLRDKPASETALKGGRHTVYMEGPELIVPSPAHFKATTSAGLCQSVTWVAEDRDESTCKQYGEKLNIVLDMQLSPSEEDEELSPHSMFKIENNLDVLCDKVKAHLTLNEGQRVTLVLHSTKSAFGALRLGASIAEASTRKFWTQWARKCLYEGMRAEQVQRSLLCLKLLTYQPTGAIVAAPTFGLPESKSPLSLNH